MITSISQIFILTIGFTPCFAGPTVQSNADQWRELCYGLIGALAVVTLLALIYIIITQIQARRHTNKYPGKWTASIHLSLANQMLRITVVCINGMTQSLHISSVIYTIATVYSQWHSHRRNEFSQKFKMFFQSFSSLICLPGSWHLINCTFCFC